MFLINDAEKKNQKDNIEKQNQLKLASQIEGKKIKSFFFENKNAVFNFEDGTRLEIVTISHHGAGSHLELR